MLARARTGMHNASGFFLGRRKPVSQFPHTNPVPTFLQTPRQGSGIEREPLPGIVCGHFILDQGGRHMYNHSAIETIAGRDCRHRPASFLLHRSDDVSSERSSNHDAANAIATIPRVIPTLSRTEPQNPNCDDATIIASSYLPFFNLHFLAPLSARPLRGPPSQIAPYRPPCSWRCCCWTCRFDRRFLPRTIAHRGDNIAG